MPAPSPQPDAPTAPNAARATPNVGAGGVVVIPERVPSTSTTSPPSAAPATPATPPPASIDAALHQVAAELESVRDLAASAAVVDAPREPREPKTEAPPIESIEDLDRALAEIAEQTAPRNPQAIDSHEQAQAARRKAAPTLDPPAPPAGADPTETHEPAAPADAPSDDAPLDEQPLPTGDFDAPVEPASEPQPVAAVPAPAAEAPQPMRGIPVPTVAAPQPEPVAAPAPVAAPSPAALKPRGSLRDLLLLPVTLANEPFRMLAGNRAALDTLSLIAVITIFNALCLWVFLFLR